MSTLAKLFVIIVLILSVAQTAVTSALFYHRVNWRKQFEKAKADNIKNIQHYRHMIKVREKTIQTQESLIDDRESVLKSFRTHLANEARINLMLKASLAQLNQNHQVVLANQATFTQQITNKEKIIENLQRSYDKLKMDFSKALQAKELAQVQVARLFRIKSDLENDLNELKRQYLAVRKEQEELQIKLDRLREIYPIDQVLNEEILAPPIDATVVAVIKNIEPNLVLLDKGSSNSEIKKGYKFTIYRGKDFVARVVVEKVLPTYSGARVEFQTKPIQVNDKASTHIQ